MRTYLVSTLALAAGIAAGSVLTLTGQATAGEEPTHDVPHWMTKVCQDEDSVNCWWDGGTVKPHQGKAFIREFPGRAHMTCVMFVNRPARDYCIKNR